MAEEKKELRKEKREARKKARKAMWNENKESIVQVGVAILGFIGAITGITAIVVDHKMNREEQKADLEMHYYEHGWLWDSENNVNWFAPLSNDEKKKLIEREKNGESRIDILRDMGKI